MFMMSHNCYLASVWLQFKEIILQIEKQFHLELEPQTMIYLSEARGKKLRTLVAFNFRYNYILIF